MQTHEFEVYKHSGQLGSGVLLMPLFGTVAAVVLGIVYSYADVYSPVAGYVSIVLTFMFALGVGFILKETTRIGKCRSVGFTALIGLVVSLVALYSAWATFAYILLKRMEGLDREISLITCFASPRMIWRLAVAIGEHGWYEIFGSTPEGLELWSFWVIEALILIVVIIAMAVTAVLGRVFCEQCDQWCTQYSNLLILASTQDEQQLENIARGELSALEAQENVSPVTYPNLRVETYCCDQCRSTATYQVNLCYLKQDRKGNVEVQSNEITPRFVIDRPTLEYLESLADRPLGSEDSVVESDPSESQAID